MRRGLFRSLVLALALAAGAEAATYVVAPTGNNAHPGTEAQPWQTLQKAAAAVQPGDTVRIRAGDYRVSPTWTVRRAGTADQPITYRAYGDGEVRLTNATILAAEGWTWVQGAIYQTTIPEMASPAVFQGPLPLHPPDDRARIYAVADMIPNSFYRSGTTLYVWLADGSHPKDAVMRLSPGHVVSLYDCHYTTFEGLTVEYGYNGFKQQGAATHHITYRNNTIRSIRSQGIQPVPAHAVIEGNRFAMIGVNKYTHAIYTSKPGIVIRHNVFEAIAGAGIHLYLSGALGGGGYWIEGNVFRQPRPMTVRGGGMPYYTDMIIWEAGGNTVINNVLLGEGKRGGISLNSPNNQVSHNTFVRAAPAVDFYAGKTGNHVLNNLILADGPTAFISWPAKALPQTLTANLYFHLGGTPRWRYNGLLYTTFAAYQAAAGEAQARYGDPGLLGGDQAALPAGSTAIDMGVALPSVPQDREGTPRPQGAGWDVGAYEYRP
jgi:hypothetical protein